MWDTVSLLVALVLVVLAYYKWAFGYWKRKGVPFLPPSIPGGNWGKIMIQKSSMAEVTRDLYFHSKSKGYKHAGMYACDRPVYVPVAIDLVKNVMQNDFQHFVNRGLYVNEEGDYLTNSLFFMEDDKWKFLRMKLSPTFTSSKMKMMFQIVADCGNALRDVIEDASKEPKPVDIKDILYRFTTDIIGSCAFGLECNSMKDPNCEFRQHGRLIFEYTLLEALRFPVSFAFPRSFLKFIKFRVFHPKLYGFFLNLVEKTVRYRESNNIKRNDFMHLLIQLKNKGEISDDDKDDFIQNKTKPEYTLTYENIAAQAFTFFAAGFETSSTTMSYALYEISQSQKIQDRMREEIESVLEKYENKITYDALMEMKYMDQVINETLRKYPPVPTLPRKCNADYQVPGTSVVIEKGTRVFIPVLGIHNDPEFHPNPEVFDPERFSEKEKNKIQPFTYIPFGDGPRICIAFRFGIMQTKVGLISILRNYKISLNEKTEIPLTYKKQGITLTSNEPIWLNVTQV